MFSFVPIETEDLGRSKVNVVTNDEKLFEDIIHHMDTGNDGSYIEAKEDFLIGFLESKMNQGLHDLVIKVLKQVDCTTNSKFLKFWDEAHYKKCENAKSTELTALQRFRIRKRNEPPSGICPEGGRPTLRMADDARDILRKWFRQHEQHPYPNRRKKEQLAGLAGITLNQVTTWFANARRKKKRRKTKSTDTNKQVRKPENEIRKADLHTTGSFQPDYQSFKSKPSPSPIDLSQERPSLFGNSDIRNVPALRPSCGMSYNKPPSVSSYTFDHLRCLDKQQQLHTRQVDFSIGNTPQQTVNSYYRPCMYSTVDSPAASFYYRPLFNAGHHLWSRPSSSVPAYATRPESSVITRIRMKLHQNNLQRALQASYQHVSALESLNSLRQLCDNIKTTVVSPVDYAATVRFCECENCTSTGNTNYTNCCYGSPVTDSLQPYLANSSVQRSPADWTQLGESNTRVLNSDPTMRSFQQNLYNEENIVNSSPQESQGLIHDCIIQCEPVNDKPTECLLTSCDNNSRSVSTLCEDEEHCDSHHTDSSVLPEILQLQESYGTIVGEAVQGLLNLSSQESESSF